MCGAFSGFYPPFPTLCFPLCIGVTGSCPLGGIGAHGWGYLVLPAIGTVSILELALKVEAPGCLRRPTSTQRRNCLYSKNYSIVIFQQIKLPQFRNLQVLKNPSIYSHIIFSVNSVSSFHTSFRKGTYNNTQLMTERSLYRTTKTDNKRLFCVRLCFLGGTNKIDIASQRFLNFIEFISSGKK